MSPEDQELLQEEARKIQEFQKHAGIALLCFFVGIILLWSIYRCCSIGLNQHRESRQAKKTLEEVQA